MIRKKYILIRNGIIYFLVFLAPFIFMPLFGVNRVGGSIGPILAIIVFIVSKVVESKIVKETDQNH